jgi:pimeloyl-ACP methyl ester carboxylesterase
MSKVMNWSGFSRAGTEDLKLPYAEQGDGEPAVLVHGSPADHRIWDQHQRIIGSRYRSIALSQRYFGRDPWLDSGEHFSISTLADDLASFVRGLALGSVTIVGWSFGGAVCLTMAARHRELVERMFLYEPSLMTFVTDTDDVKAAVEDRSAMTSSAMLLATSGDLAGAVGLLMDGVNDEDGAFDRLPPEVRAMMIENARVLPLMFAGPPPPAILGDDLRALDCPVTIALGEDSRLSYQIAARTAQSLLPLGRLEIVRGARHLWPIQDPQRFSQLVLHSLDRM